MVDNDTEGRRKAEGRRGGRGGRGEVGEREEKVNEGVSGEGRELGRREGRDESTLDR